MEKPVTPDGVPCSFHELEKSWGVRYEYQEAIKLDAGSRKQSARGIQSHGWKGQIL